MRRLQSNVSSNVSQCKNCRSIRMNLIRCSPFDRDKLCNHSVKEGSKAGKCKTLVDTPTASYEIYMRSSKPTI